MKRPPSTPLTKTETARLDILLREAAGQLPAAECNELLGLWARQLADGEQARRTIGGMQAAKQRASDRQATGESPSVWRVVSTSDDPGEIAVHPAGVDGLRRAMAATYPQRDLWAAGLTLHGYMAPGRFAGLPVVADVLVPVGEVHVRVAGS